MTVSKPKIDIRKSEIFLTGRIVSRPHENHGLHHILGFMILADDGVLHSVEVRTIRSDIWAREGDHVRLSDPLPDHPDYPHVKMLKRLTRIDEKESPK